MRALMAMAMAAALVFMGSAAHAAADNGRAAVPRAL